MLRKRTFLFLSLSFLIPCKDLYSQGPRLTNTLLWRVSGNNLAKPSYLYGTMHLTDKRVFQLGDSLYKAIEQTEGFAAELDMNRLGMQMVNYLMADREAKRATEAVKVKDAVSAETWERYKDHLQDKFYKSADKITIDDLEEIKSSLESDLFKKGDMPTFLDAHLFGLARKQGKWVGGLEDFRDQLEHINAEDIEDKIQTALFDDKYYRSGIERMISIYNSQLLDSLDALMYRSENGHKDYIMIKRNLKMAKMMDSLSAVRSTFFAVGAAHLPGDSGVIALLQKKGFKITPVISSKKISADKYVVKSKESPWVPASIADSSYRLEMPGVAESMEVLKSMGLDMKMFFDISFMKMYITLGIGLPAERKKLGADSLFNSMRNRFFEKADNTKERNITVNDVDGKEYTASTADGELKLQVFMPGLEEVIVNAVFSLSKKSISDDETVKFFQSFSYLGFNKSTSEAGTEKTWSTLTYQNLLFSVDMPSKPRETKDVNSEEGKIVYTYQSLDVKNQVFYGMSVTSVKEGLYQPGIDSSYFLSVKDGLKTRMESSKFLDSSFVTSSGFTGYKASMSAKAQGEAIETKALWVVRGNRIYYIYAVYSPVESNRIAAERYLGSFKILPVNTTNWKTYTSPDSSFSVVSTLPLKKF
ncbi:MAG TPA: TraB/GumN family protein, partial [Chitinophagaceae bacterium]|nr:TraB/GumN family protein [Chitinophagaceae bacterium]